MNAASIPCLIVGAVAVLSGCRISRDAGYWYGTADANSIGQPSIVLERVRTDAYRAETPRRMLPHIETARVPRRPAQPQANVRRDEPVYTGSTPLLDISPVSFESLDNPGVPASGLQQTQPAAYAAWLFQ